MKKIVLACLLLCLCSFFIKAQTMVSSFAAYGAGIKDFGVGATGEVFIKDNISLTGSVITYFPKTANDIHKNWFEINFNSHYYFFDRNAFQFYGLGGFNYSIRRFKNKIDDSKSFSRSVINFNLGTGINYKNTSGIIPFSELKMIIGPTASVVICAGIKINLKK